MLSDAYMPLSEGTYSYQFVAETPWRDTTADGLASLLEADHTPEFRTVLARHGEDRDTFAYVGPLYLDFDSQDLAKACEAFRATLQRLEDLGLDLATIRLFASGGKGFHIEIPQACFMRESKPLAGLPAVYKDMAALLAQCEELDERVYSAGKGRMWRVPNRKRANGNFKVPLTVDEALSISPETYRQLVSAPRPFPALEPASLNVQLELVFKRAVSKLAGAAEASKRRKASGDKAAEFKQRFGNDFPPSVLALTSGAVASPKGWNEVALQLALCAHAVGMDEDTCVARCKRLIASHLSDGRYSNPYRRERELRNLYRYAERAGYTVSAGGIRSILPRGMRADDLRGL